MPKILAEKIGPSTIPPVTSTSRSIPSNPSNVPRSSVAVPQRARPTGTLPKISSASSISLAKALGPKTAAKTILSSSGGRATIAEMLGATAIPKANKTSVATTLPRPQTEKIKARMKMKEKSSSVYSLGAKGSVKVGPVTRTAPVKMGKGKFGSGNGKLISSCESLHLIV